MFPLPLLGGAYLGGVLGANDAANVFGTAVASRVVSFRMAAVLCGLAIVAGAYFEGSAGVRTYRALALQTGQTIAIAAPVAALIVSFMIWKRLPVSSSQAVVGALAGIGLATDTLREDVIVKVVLCWLATPVSAMLLSWPLYYLFGWAAALRPTGILTRDKLLWNGLLIVGVYGSYALGANNVANAAGMFSHQFKGIADQDLTLWGGIAMALGAAFFGKKMMLTVGGEIMRLNAFTALVAVSAMSLTVHLFAVIGVPVSTGQAIIGAIVGIGLLRNPAGVNYRLLRQIGFAWFLTPLASLVLTAAGYAIFIH